MIKKQIDWDVRVQPLAENANNDLTKANLKNFYPAEDGWELLSTQPAQVGGNVINIVFTFARYEYVSESPTVIEQARQEIKRGPGRPPKVVEEEVEPA